MCDSSRRVLAGSLRGIYCTEVNYNGIIKYFKHIRNKKPNIQYSFHTVTSVLINKMRQSTNVHVVVWLASPPSFPYIPGHGTDEEV